MVLDPTAIPFRVYARDEALSLAADLSDSLTEFECVLRFNGVGSWTMTLAAGASGASALTRVGALRGVVVLDEAGRTVFSGPLTQVRRSGDGADDLLELSGTCDNGLLARRWARPDPAGPPYTTTAYDVRTGKADQVIAEYVTANCGPAAGTTYGHPERVIPGLGIPGTSGLGTTITGKARFDNLLELCQGLAAAGGGLRFQTRQRDVINNQIEFIVTKPVDKSALVIFDPDTGNLTGRTYAETAPAANYVVAAGGGEDTRRTFSERGDSASIARYGLRETFRDARDTDNTGVLGQRIDETLAQSRESISVEVEAVDTDTVRYGQEYSLGDLVSTRAGGIETVGYVSEITLTIARESAADEGIGMIRPTIQTLGVIKESAGLGVAGYGGGLAGWLARTVGGESVGTVKLWVGTIATIPPKWQLMDGTSGTTDMRGKFLVGADGDSGSGGSYPLFGIGGSASAAVGNHQHGPGTLAFPHTHSGAPHTHTFTTGTPSTIQNNLTTITPEQANAAHSTHTHTGTTDGATFTGNTGGVVAGTPTGLTDTAGAATIDTRPPYKALLFIQRMSS